MGRLREPFIGCGLRFPVRRPGKSPAVVELEDKMSSLRKLMASGLFLAVFTGMMFAQGGATGAIGGVVQDPTGAVIANAKVSVKSEATGEVLRQVTTDSSGLFTATLLPVDTYTVE